MDAFENVNFREEQVLNAFISKLPEGLVICNSQGEIRLCNEKALHCLLPDVQIDDPENVIIGHPITSFIDTNLMEHALKEINEWLKQDLQDMVSHFILQKRHLILQIQAVPVLNSAGQFTGFVLIISDITQQSHAEKRVESLLQVLSKNARSPLASIRAAVEAMIEFPDMDAGRQHQFQQIIQKESVILSDMLNQASDTYASLTKAIRSLLPMFCKELLETIARRAQEKLGVRFIMKGDLPDEHLFIKADPYTLVMAVLFVLYRLKQETRLETFYSRFRMENKIICFDIQWQGTPIRPETIKQWERQNIEVDGQTINLTLKDVLTHHHGALWTYTDTDALEHNSYLRFFVPVENEKTTTEIDPLPILSESRTQLKDFELFDHSVQNPELDDRLLTELSYTSLIREINQAKAIEEVIGKHSQLPRLIHSMITSGTKIRTVTWLVTAFAEAILTKIFELAMAELGPAPVPFAFITLGSEGRKEQTLKTDQDNAIIFEDPKTDEGRKRVQAYFLTLGEKVCQWLDQAGYDYCDGGIMAKNPKWCQPVSVWEEYFLKWIRITEPENLMHTSIFFDFRLAYGEQSIVDTLRQTLFESMPGNNTYFRSMAQNAMQFTPPIGFFNNLITKKNRETQKMP